MSNPLNGQQFITPEVPARRTLDGQTYPSTQQPTVLRGRIIEGRVLTGEDGQIGDRTLRFPQSSSSDSSSLNEDGTQVFGPIDIQPLTGNQPSTVRRPQQSLRSDRQNTSPQKRKRTADLRKLANREIIRQRYPDGNIHIARHVMFDAQGNQVNDGQWKLFDQQGALIASGTYRNGAMDGKWSRLHTAGSGGIFDNEPFIEFDGPYASHATFELGELSGPWTIEDRRGQKIFEMPYRDGRRNGVAVWYLPQGKIYRRMEFKDDVPVGNLVEYDKRGKISRKETYRDGMKIVNNVSYYRPSGQKRQESIVQRGRLELEGEDDWWEAKPAPMVVTGNDVQNGPIRSWYENGQTKMVGNLANDVRVGEFNWWYSNGVKQLTGQYNRSGEKVGRWRWWHDNGIKSIDGGYTDGQPDGRWKWWNAQGELINDEDFDSQANVADTANADDTADADDAGNTDDSFSIDMTEASSQQPNDDDMKVSKQEISAQDASVQDTSMQDTSMQDSSGVDALSDAFGENPADLLDETSEEADPEIRSENPTDELEGIEPEAFDTEEIPEPETSRRMPASLRSTDISIPDTNKTDLDSTDIEAFFKIEDDE